VATGTFCGTDVRNFSIRSRLTFWYAATLGAALVLFTAGVWFALVHSIRHTVDRELRSRLAAVRYYLQQQSHEGDESNLTQEIAEDIDAVAATSLIRIRSAAGEWIYRSPGTRAWNVIAPNPETLPENGSLSTAIVRGAPIRILSAPLSIGLVQIGLSLTEFQSVQNLLAWTVLLGSPLLMLAASLGGYWMSGRALRPVDELVMRAQSISAHNLTDRLPSRGTSDELDRLADTLNAMLARLESAFERITRFTADASHELRTPVAIVRTTAEVTRAKSRTPAEHEKAWEVVLTQANEMTRLIDDLLLLARADSETDAPLRELIDAAEVLREACEEIRVMADVAGLSLNVQIPQECILLGDPADLRRIVLILLDNAIKYTPKPGGIFVQLSLDGSTKPRMAVISVRDTGIGILQDDLPHIFDRFYRASRDRSRKTGGVGLGLTIARYLAERHEGYIQVESTPRRGSTFYLFLPV